MTQKMYEKMNASAKRSVLPVQRRTPPDRWTGERKFSPSNETTNASLSSIVLPACFGICAFVGFFPLNPTRARRNQHEKSTVAYHARCNWSESFVLTSTSISDLGLVIIQSDGLRCVARYVYEHRIVDNRLVVKVWFTLRRLLFGRASDVLLQEGDLPAYTFGTKK